MDTGAANERLRTLAAEAKSILMEAVKAERQLTPTEQERFDALLHEKAQIEKESS